jgi:hypothetical protein
MVAACRNWDAVHANPAAQPFLPKMAAFSLIGAGATTMLNALPSTDRWIL